MVELITHSVYENCRADATSYAGCSRPYVDRPRLPERNEHVGEDRPILPERNEHVGEAAAHHRAVGGHVSAPRVADDRAEEWRAEESRALPADPTSTASVGSPQQQPSPHLARPERLL